MITPDFELWQGMLRHLKAQHPALCRQWFEEIVPLGIEAGVLRLRARTAIHRDYLERSCADAFSDAARTASQRLISVQFFGPDDHVPMPKGAASPSAAGSHAAGLLAGGSHGPGTAGTHVGRAHDARSFVEHKAGSPATILSTTILREVEPVKWDLTSKVGRGGEGRTSLVIDPDYAFENFVIGPNNRMAHAAAIAVANQPGRAYNPYFVHGGVGLGKTHLLQAICVKIRENNPDTRFFYTSCEGFTTQFMDAVQRGEMSAFRHRFRDVDVLVIDDVHCLAKLDRSQEEFFHTFNALYQDHRQIVLSSDTPPEEIPDLEERLVSRFKCGLVISVSAPEYQTRIEIVRNKARMRGFELPDEVIGLIAERVNSNVRELEGAITKLFMLHTMEKRPVDLAMAAASLGEALPGSEKHVNIEVIIDAVTSYYGVKISDLQSPRRQRSIALPRQVCMHLARRHTRHSLEEIGGFFGGRDHTTVMHAVKTVDDRCHVDPDFARVIQTLDGQLRHVRAR